MNIRPSTIIKVIILIAIILYVTLTPLNLLGYNLSKVDAFFVLILSLILIIKSRNNLPSLIMFIFISYINYSIVIGEYLVGEYLSAPFTQVKTVDVYGLNIRILLLFMTILSLFYKGKKYDLLRDRLITKNSGFIFYLIVFMIVISFLFGINRGNLDYYEVRISPLFEYSKLLFLFAYYYSGEIKARKKVIFILLIIFVFQDTFYGGRVTSLQLLIFLSITIFVQKLTFSRVIIASITGIILMGSVGVYRSTFDLINFSLIDVINNLFNNLLVFDTAIFSYYASATHIAAFNELDFSRRLDSLINFIISIPLGSNEISSEVTHFVRELGYFNMGGGLLPTHFYFWLGWFGVILIGFLVVFIINKLKYTNDYQHLLFLGIIINVPRWYLYSPNQLFRGTLFFITFLYVGFCIIESMLSKGKNTRYK